MQISSWQKQFQELIKDPAALADTLQLPLETMPYSEQAASLFPLRVPAAYLQRIDLNNPSDPLLRQVLPHPDEGIENSRFGRDPTGEHGKHPVPGVLHKYRGRALLVTTGACAIHCRYCFRRHFPYSEATAARGEWQAALDYLAGDPTITEIILSGGDPLSLGDPKLAQLIERLDAIPHLQRLRLHSRLPVVLPARVTPVLVEMLTHSRMRAVLVIHANHPDELDDEVQEALHRMTAAGLTLLNQSVLLRGVNNDAGILARLSERLFESGVLPYYLHMLDAVAGAAHFEVDEEDAAAIMDELRGRLPGYLLPRLVREVAGEPYKLPLG